MKVHNYLRDDHPYYRSKTRLQWRQEGRRILTDAKGMEMWTNQYCGDTAIYYTLDETCQANDGEIAAWKQQDREYREKRKQQRIEEWRAREERERQAMEREQEKERKRQADLTAWMRRYAEFGLANIICLDTETTGLGDTDEVLQLSIVDGRGEVLFNEYVRPTHTAEWPRAQAVNGISPEMVAGKFTIEEHLPRLNKIMANAKLIIGYNLDFDLDFLCRAGIEIPGGMHYFDVMTVFAKVYGEWSEYYQSYRWQPLAFCADYYGYERTGSFHDSLEDTKATLFCFNKMVRE